MLKKRWINQKLLSACVFALGLTFFRLSILFLGNVDQMIHIKHKPVQYLNIVNFKDFVSFFIQDNTDIKL